MKFPAARSSEKDTVAPGDDQGSRVLLTAAMAHACYMKGVAMSAIPRQAVELADQLLKALALESVDRPQ